MPKEVRSVYDELTEVDIQKMREEIDYRVNTLRPKLLEDVKVARSFGDLSENFEYKAAKREKNRNDSRVRYLERMIATAKVITASSSPDVVGLFDQLVIYDEEEGAERPIQIVTTLRQNALEGLISKESPVGRAVIGHRVGDRVQVEVSADYSYFIVIRSITKGKDDTSLDISKF
jgi:transcription elongation factor GreA